MGITSLMQPCDIWLNKAVKSNIKTQYHAYKNSLKLKTGENVSVPRELFVQWVENAFQFYNE